jgi:hypothetical protein
MSAFFNSLLNLYGDELILPQRNYPTYPQPNLQPALGTQYHSARLSGPVLARARYLPRYLTIILFIFVPAGKYLVLLIN